MEQRLPNPWPCLRPSCCPDLTFALSHTRPGGLLRLGHLWAQFAKDAWCGGAANCIFSLRLGAGQVGVPHVESTAARIPLRSSVSDMPGQRSFHPPWLDRPTLASKPSPWHRYLSRQIRRKSRSCRWFASLRVKRFARSVHHRRVACGVGVSRVIWRGPRKTGEPARYEALGGESSLIPCGAGGVGSLWLKTAACNLRTSSLCCALL